MDPVQLPFDDMDTAVAFTNENDLHRFMYIPRTYFNAVALREPKQLAKATETLIFKSSIDIVEELNPSTMKIVSRRHKYHSCDLRILETTHTEGWRTIRRLVISSSAGEKHPWCREYFLPKDRVQLSSGEVGREIKVKWSDCVQEDYTKTDGKYHTLFSHIYDDTKPNHAFSFLFHDELDCKQFQQKILKLSSAPAFTCAVNPSETCAIYDIQDTEPTPKTYRAILVTYKRLDWTYSQLFYTFRDTDFRYDQRQLRIHFTQLQYCDYVSSHVQRLHKPEPHSPPRFSHCEKKLNQLNLDFSDESISQTFLSALSSHTLIFSRRAHHISTKQPRFGGASKSNKGAADVQIWKKGNNMRLVTRWGDLVEDRWLSMSLSLSALKYSIDNNRVSLPNTIYDRGKLVDIVNLVAVKPKEKSDGRRTGYVTIAFETSRGEFIIYPSAWLKKRRHCQVLKLLLPSKFPAGLSLRLRSHLRKIRIR